MKNQINRRSFVSLGMGLIGSAGLVACGQGNFNSSSQGRPAPEIRSSNEVDAGSDVPTSNARGATLAAIYHQVTNSMYGFTIGNPNAKKVVHVVFDASCPHCGNTWVKTKSLYNDVKFIWMPVPLLGEQSALYGAMILASENPAKAMDTHEVNVLNKTPFETLDEALKEKGLPGVENNNNVAKKIKLDAVPFILHRRDSGEIVSTVGGVEAPEIKLLLG